MKFSVALITVDRSPKQNFLAETVANLRRAGVFDSPLLDQFSVIDSGSESLQFIYDAFEDIDRGVYIVTGMRSPTMNAAAAFRRAAYVAKPGSWVLFLEDDIDVCASFLESTAAWLADQPYLLKHRVFPLGANYPQQLKEARRVGQTAWQYPIDGFYGTLAVAVDAADAREIATALERAQQTSDRPDCYDLHMAAWAKRQGVRDLLTPVPSFVQHIGTESIIRPESVFHTYETWPGRTWQYFSKVEV